MNDEFIEYLSKIYGKLYIDRLLDTRSFNFYDSAKSFEFSNIFKCISKINIIWQCLNTDLEVVQLFRRNLNDNFRCYRYVYDNNSNDGGKIIDYNFEINNELVCKTNPRKSIINLDIDKLNSFINNYKFAK